MESQYSSLPQPQQPLTATAASNQGYPQQPLRPTIDTSYGLPSEAQYRRIEQQQQAFDQPKRPAALLPADPETLARNGKTAKPPGMDTLAGLKDVGKLIWDTPIQTLGAAARLFEGKYPGEDVGIPDYLRELAKKKSEQRLSELTPAQRATPVLPRLPFMDKPITRGDIADTSASTGFSAVAMGAGLAGGLAGGAAGAAEGGIPALYTAPAGAMAASGAAAYKMDRVAATEQLIDFFQKAKGKPLTKAEQRELVDAHDSELFSHAIWEAGPEALSTALGVIPGVKNIVKGLSKKALGRLAKGIVGLYGTELATETVTQMGQQRAESRMGITPEAKRDWSNPSDWDKSFQEVAAPTLLTATGFGGAGAAAGAVSRLTGEQEPGQTPGPAPGQAPPQPAQQEPTQQPLADQELFDQTRHFLESGQISPDTEQWSRIRDYLAGIAGNPEMTGVVEGNRDIFEAMGVIDPVTPEAGQEFQSQGTIPSETAPETGFREPQGELQTTGEPQFTEEVALARAQAIQPKDRTREEAQLVKDYQKRVDAENLAIRRAMALPDNLRTPEEREIVKAAEQKEQEGYAKEKLEAGQAAETAKERAAEPAASQIKTPKKDEPAVRKAIRDFADLNFEEGQAEIQRILSKPEAERSTGERYIAGVVQSSATVPAPATSEAADIPKAATTAINKQAEQAAGEHPAHTSMTRAIDQGGINIDLARKNGWDADSMRDIRRPGLFSSTAKMGPDEMAATLGYESEEAMKNEWVKAPTKKELKAASQEEQTAQYQGLDETVKELEKEGFDLGSEESVSVGGLNPGDEVIVTDRRGIPDKLTHKGYDEQGNALLQDGVLIKADPFEEIKILAKKTGDKKTSEQVQGRFEKILETTDPQTLDKMAESLSGDVQGNKALEPYQELIGAAIARRKNALEKETSEQGPAPPTGTKTEPAGAAPAGGRKELLEPITEKEDTAQLNTEKRTRYLGEQETKAARTESKRRQIGEAKKFQEERRDPKKHTPITEQRDYADKLPANTERLMNLTAERYRAFNDAQASVDENKEHLVKLFNKAGKKSISVVVDGQKFTVKKPEPGKEQVILNLAGRNAIDALNQKYKDAGLLTYDYDQGVTLMVQPAVAGKSKAAAYGPKTLEAAAIEHVEFMRGLADARFAKDAARRRIKEQIIPELENNGIDHVWTNTAKDTTFWIRRSDAKFKIEPKERAEQYAEEREEIAEGRKPELVKRVDPGKLGSAGRDVSESKVLGLKKGERAERQAQAEAELDQLLKSISGTPLPKGQRADIMGELTKQLGRGVLAQQKRGVFEIVSPERAAQALVISNSAKASASSEKGLRVAAVKELRDDIESVGREIDVNSNGTITVYHRTSTSNAKSIKENGFNEGSFFSLTKRETEGHTEQHKGRQVVLSVNVDPRDISFSTGTQELYAEHRLVKKGGVWYAPDATRNEPASEPEDYIKDTVQAIDGVAIKVNGEWFLAKIFGKPASAWKVGESVAPDVKYSEHGQRLEGLTFPDGKVWLVEGNIEKGQAAGVLAHELGVHARKLGFKDEKSFERILKRIEVLSQTDKDVKAARERVPENTPAQNVNEETLAYLVSDAPQHGLVKRFISAIKKFLAERGWFHMTLDKLTPADMQAMAQNAIRADVGIQARAAEGVNEFAQSVKMSTAKAADKIKGMANFKKWFGDSKVVDEDGEPLVVYHGTDSEFTVFDKSKLGKNFDDPLSKEGFFFTSEEGLAGRYGDDIVEAYVKIQDPHMVDAEALLKEEYDYLLGRGEFEGEFDEFLEEFTEGIGGPYGYVEQVLLDEVTTAKSSGNDGVVIDFKSIEDVEVGALGKVAIVFEPAQIKSIHNTGEWSATDPDIMKSMSAPAQEARRNTENLNATKGGQTSTTSAEAGEKAIRSMMSTLRQIGKDVESGLYKSHAKEKGFIDKYRSALNNPDLTIQDGTALLSDFVRQSDVPPDTKRRIGQLVKQLTAAKRPETQRQRLAAALETLESDIAKRLRTKTMNQIKRVAGPKREGAIKRGSFYHEYEKDMAGIRSTVHLPKAQVDSSILRAEARLSLLEQRLKNASPDEATGIRQNITDTEVKLHQLRTFGNLSGKSLDELLSAKLAAERIRNLGRSKLRAVKTAWQAEIDKKTDWLAKEITGEDAPKPETAAEKSRRKKREKGMVGRTKGAYSAVANSIQSFEFVLDDIATKSGKKILRSRAVQEFGGMAHAGQRAAEEFNREAVEEVFSRGSEIFNVEKPKTLTGKVAEFVGLYEGLTKKLQKLSKKTGEIRVKGDTIQLSPMEAAYLYSVRKEAGSEKIFKKMGFTQESFSDISALMTPELTAWADYLHGDLLTSVLQGETEAYQDVNGVTRTPVGLFRDGQTEIPIMNLNSAVMNRVFDANHYRAWAVPSKTFNDVFSAPEIRGYIEQHRGASTLQALDRFLEDFAKTPKELRGDQAWMDKLRSNVVMSMIGADPTTFFKQLTSIPAYAADIPVADFVKNFAHGLANFRSVKRLIDSSGMAQERFGSGFDRDIHEASKSTAEQIIGGKVTRVRDVLMSMTKLGDRAAIYAGYTVYKYHYDKALAAGKGAKEAHDIGILEFEKATERTQQAAGVKDRGSFERGGSLQKLFTMYMTSPAAYTRQTMAAVRHFKTDPINSSKRLLIFNVLLPMMFQAVASGFVGVGGDDEDETAEFWKKEFRAVLLGPFMGIPIARDIASGIWDSMMGEWYGSDVSYSPVTEVGKSLTQAVFHASKGLREGDEKAIKKAKGELFDFLGYMTGLPTKPAERLWEGWTDVASGETKRPGMALSGYSRAARNERDLGK